MHTSARRIPRADLGPTILKVAAALFADRGFEATTMQNIAAKVGITAAGLYYYFRSKQELLFEVLKTSLEALVAKERAGVAAASDMTERPVAELLAFAYQHVKFQLDELEESAVYGAAFYGTHFMLNALSERQLVELRELQAQSYGLLRRILNDGIEQGVFSVEEPAAIASAIIALGEFAPAWFKSGGRLSPHDVAALYARLALRMVASDDLIGRLPAAIPGAERAPSVAETERAPIGSPSVRR